MSLPNRPRIVYGSTTLDLSLPCIAWEPEDRLVGGMDRTASGVLVGYVQRTEPLLHTTLRFTEAEWPAISAWLRSAMVGTSFTLWLDQQDSLTSGTYYLEQPSIEAGGARPSRSPFASVYELAVTIRRTTDAVIDFRFTESRTAWEQILELAEEDGWLAAYDPTNPNTRTVVDGYVSVIADGLGNLPNLAQATAGSRPAFLSSEFGALAGLDGTNEVRFLRTAAFSANLTQPNFILAIGRNESEVQAGRFLVDGIASGARNGILMKNATGNPFIALGGSEMALGPDGDTEPHFIAALLNGTSSQIYLDGHVRYIGNAGTHELSGLTLGERFASNGTHWDGAYGLLLVYDGDPPLEVKQRMFDLISRLADIPQQLVIVADRAVSMRSDGTTVYEKDADTPATPASTTKLMTAYTMRRRGRSDGGRWISNAMLTDTVTITADDVVSTGGIGLAAGDVLTYQELIYGMILPSGNDCANAIGRNVGNLIRAAEGSVGDGLTRFLEEMEIAGAELGWTGHNFNDTSGNDDGNQMSARQLAQLGIAVSEDETLVSICGALTHDVVISGGPSPRNIPVVHTIDPNGVVKFPEFVAGKTGTTTAAGACLILIWDHPDGTRQATAILGSDSSITVRRYIDARALMDLASR